MTKEKTTIFAVLLAMSLIIVIFISSMIVLHEKKQSHSLAKSVEMCEDRYNAAIDDYTAHLKKSGEELDAQVQENAKLSNQRNLLLDEVKRLEASNEEMRKQIESLRIELQSARAPKPTPKPIKKKKHIPYDIAPSQQ